MKKRILSAVAVLALMFGPMCIQTANSQILILDNEEEYVEGEEQEESEDTLVDEQGLELPMTPGKAGITIDRYAPLGSGIFALGCLGGAYLLGKRRRKE